MRRDLIALPDSSRVWIYQSAQAIPDKIAAEIQDEIIAFTQSWMSHGKVVESYGHLFHNHFLVLVADERNHVSGCSIDSSVHFIQKLGQRYGFDFFDRLNFLYFNKGKIESVHQSAFAEALKKGDISKDTLIFNNLVNTKKDFINHWVGPVSESWHKRFL